MANHVDLIKQIVCKNSVEDIIRAYEKQQIDPVKYREHNEFVLLDVRRVTMALKLLKFTVHRVYIETKDSGQFSEVGWVVDRTCTYCLSCCRDLGPFMRKHHCRACGDRICAPCTIHLPVQNLEMVGSVQICLQCHRNTPPVRLYSCNCIIVFSYSLCSREANPCL